MHACSAFIFFCDWKGWFVSDLVGNPEDQFSHVTAYKGNTDFSHDAARFFYMSCLVGKPTMWLRNGSDTSRTVQGQKIVRGWKFCTNLESRGIVLYM